MTTAQHFLEMLAVNPGDWPARLAYADLLAESGNEAGAHYQRGRAWLWAWVESIPHMKLCFVHGWQRSVLVAHFTQRGLRRLSGPGWRDPYYLQNAKPPDWPTLQIAFESPGHDVPGDLGRQRKTEKYSVARINAGACAWLLPTGHALDDATVPGEPVVAGATVAQFARAVERAGGWWGVCRELPV